VNERLACCFTHIDNEKQQLTGGRVSYVLEASYVLGYQSCMGWFVPRKKLCIQNHLSKTPVRTEIIIFIYSLLSKPFTKRQALDRGSLNEDRPASLIRNSFTYKRKIFPSNFISFHQVTSFNFLAVCLFYKDGKQWVYSRFFHLIITMLNLHSTNKLVDE
jgi:hypothetical protein